MWNMKHCKMKSIGMFLVNEDGLGSSGRGLDSIVQKSDLDAGFQAG